LSSSFPGGGPNGGLVGMRYEAPIQDLAPSRAVEANRSREPVLRTVNGSAEREGNGFCWAGDRCGAPPGPVRSTAEEVMGVAGTQGSSRHGTLRWVSCADARFRMAQILGDFRAPLRHPCRLTGRFQRPRRSNRSARGPPAFALRSCSGSNNNRFTIRCSDARAIPSGTICVGMKTPLHHGQDAI